MSDNDGNKAESAPAADPGRERKPEWWRFRRQPNDGGASAPAAEPSPWWHLALFLGAVVVLLIRAPYLAEGLGALSAVIVAHEFGHFIVARWQGMRVETFSLGFGAPLFRIEFGGTGYQIAPILIGGYVKPAGENPETDEQVALAKPDEFMGRPWWSRGLVTLAGPAMNLVLPVAAFFLVYASIGRQDPQGPPQVEQVFADSGAAAAGLLPGDSVVKVNGEQVNDTAQLGGLVDKLSRLDTSKPLTVGILREGRPVQLTVTTKLNANGKYLMGVQVRPGPQPFTTTLLAPEVMMPAEKAGFRAGDVVLRVDNKPLKDGFAFSALFAKSQLDQVPVVVDRAGKEITLMVTRKQPLPDEFDPVLVGLLGLNFEPADKDAALHRERLAPWPAFTAAVKDTAATALLIVISIKEIFAGHANARESLGGPVAILRMASQQAEEGWEHLMQLMCSISVMLGLMNLLPIPILDGATTLFCVVEGVRGRALKIRTQVLLQNVGLALIGSLFLFTFVNDLLRWSGR